MRKVVLFLVALSFGESYAQEIPKVEITPKNSWFKAGLIAGIPMEKTRDVASFNVGLEVRAQYLFDSHLAVGVASGYNHFFAKDDIEDFGIVPLAAYTRYYFQKEGVFVGVDFGYGFLTNNEDNSGGMYFNPQLGYHNDNWNIYGYYQNTFIENYNIRCLGIGATYNIKFK